MDAGKGCPVIAADGLQQTSSLKQAFKTLAHRLALRILHHAQFQHIAAVLISYSQRLTALAVTAPPAFKVHRPHLVGHGATPAERGVDRKSTRLNSVTNRHLVCRLLLEKKKKKHKTHKVNIKLNKKKKKKSTHI